MRTRCVVWSVVTLAVLTGRSMAQTPAAAYPADMGVVVPEVEVRSGPSMKYYPTSKLFQGQRVTVVKESDQPGWVAIKPPPGSVSWIREKFVKKTNDNLGFVQVPLNGSTTVRPGCSLFEHALDVEKDKVPDGCHVVIVGQPFQWQNETWLPIQPTPGELRYLPMTAVRVPPAPVQVASGFPSAVGGDLLSKGDQARSAGNIEKARQLYQQARDTLPEPQKSVASNKLGALPPMGVPGGVPVAASQSNWQSLGGTAASTPLPPLGATSPPPLGAAAQSASNHSVPYPTMTTVQPPQWSSWGYLRKAGFEKDGQTVFVLEDNNKHPLMYAVERPHAVPVLEKLIHRPVCLYGSLQYRSEDFPRIYYMVVTSYTHLQPR